MNGPPPSGLAGDGLPGDGFNVHPDRRAASLADRARLLRQFEGPIHPPSAGSVDARMDLKILAARVVRLLADPRNDAARARLADLQTADLWAGTVPDGVARGFVVALEEALSLARPAKTIADESGTAPLDPAVLRADCRPPKSMRRLRDFLVASGGPRIRFSRKGGVLLVDRKNDVHSADCIRFEDQTDVGDLDGFAPAPQQRPRLFSPSALQPIEYENEGDTTRLVLAGRLGRRSRDIFCRLAFVGRQDQPFLRMIVTIHNGATDHRLRLRLLGVGDDARIQRFGPPPFEAIRSRGRDFLATTLVRAVGRLRVGDSTIEVPEAQCLCVLQHELHFGE